MKPVLCRWCGRKVTPTKKGHLPSHLSHGGQKCHGIGMDARHCKPEAA